MGGYPHSERSKLPAPAMPIRARISGSLASHTYQSGEGSRRFGSTVRPATSAQLGRENKMWPDVLGIGICKEMGKQCNGRQK